MARLLNSLQRDLRRRNRYQAIDLCRDTIQTRVARIGVDLIGIRIYRIYSESRSKQGFVNLVSILLRVAGYA